jgi:hypothetical protein
MSNTTLRSLMGLPADPAEVNASAFAWLGQDPLSLPVYAACFGGAAVEIMGESPFLNAKAAGISLALKPNHTVRAVFLYSEGVEGFSAYADALPAGVSLSSSRADVQAACGEAAMSMEAGGIGLMAIDFAFDRYESGDHYLRFEYVTGDSAIRLVTLGLCSD